MALIYPSDVDAGKADLQAQLAGLAATVAGLGSRLDPTTAAQWAAEYASVSTFAKSDTSIWGLGSQMDQVEAYQKELAGWNSKLAALGGNVPPPPADPSQSNPAVWQPGPDGQSPVGQIAGTVTTVAIVGGAVYVLHAVLSLRRKR